MIEMDGDTLSAREALEMVYYAELSPVDTLIVLTPLVMEKRESKDEEVYTALRAATGQVIRTKGEDLKGWITVITRLSDLTSTPVLKEKIGALADILSVGLEQLQAETPDTEIPDDA